MYIFEKELVFPKVLTCQENSIICEIHDFEITVLHHWDALANDVSSGCKLEFSCTEYDLLHLHQDHYTSSIQWSFGCSLAFSFFKMVVTNF